MFVRSTNEADRDALHNLLREAFAGEDLTGLVSSLLALDPPPLSLAAVNGRAIAGHVLFTPAADAGGAPCALLGPLAVAPAHQRKGVGTDLIGVGLRQLGESGTARVLVLGDPGYYGRFGFRAETRIAPPFALPPEWDSAWQSLSLGGAEATPGPIALPAPWHDPALWSP